VEASSPPEWRSDLRTLLLSLSEARRRDAWQRLQKVYDEVSAEVIDEVAKQGELAARQPIWRLLRARPLLGYRSACASLHRTMVDYVLPEQAGSSVVVRRREVDGNTRLRYVLMDDAMEGDTKPAETEANADSVEKSIASMDTVSQARALFVLLRQLPTTTAWALEKTAAESSEESGDKWKARTPDLETPEYKVVFSDPNGVFEVREYSTYSTVQTEAAPGGSTGGNTQFFALANYIFGKSNEAQEKMSMTTPVQVDSRTGSMSFIMPRNYWGEALEKAPAPMKDAGVRLVVRPSETVAVSVFGGYARSSIVEGKKKALLEAISRSSDAVEIVDEEAVQVMQYNDPFTVPWKRRNEVAIPVRLK